VTPSTNVAAIGALHSGPVPVEARLIGYDDKALLRTSPLLRFLLAFGEQKTKEGQ